MRMTAAMPASVHVRMLSALSACVDVTTNQCVKGGRQSRQHRPRGTRQCSELARRLYMPASVHVRMSSPQRMRARITTRALESVYIAVWSMARTRGTRQGTSTCRRQHMPASVQEDVISSQRQCPSGSTAPERMLPISAPSSRHSKLVDVGCSP